MNGGGVTLIAYADAATGTQGGQVLLPAGGVSINTTSVHGLGGFVSIIAGSQPDQSGQSPAVQVGDINTGGLTGGGSVSINTNTPLGSATYGSNGSQTGGGISPSASVTSNAAVSVGNINSSGAGGNSASGQAGAHGAPGGGITINAGGNITTGNLDAYGGGGAGGSGGGWRHHLKRTALPAGKAAMARP